MRKLDRAFAMLGIGMAFFIGSADAATQTEATVASPVAQGLQRLHLPLQVLQASRSPDFADLRMLDAKGEELPIAFVPARSSTDARDAKLPLFGWPVQASGADPRSALRLKIGPDGALLQLQPPARASQPVRQWLIDASARGEEERLGWLSLQWQPAAGGLAVHVALEGSEDLLEWRPLAGAQLVDVSAEGASVKQDRIALATPQRVPRYLRLRADGALTLASVQAHWQRSAGPALDEARLAFTATASPQGPWLLDLGTAVPVDSLLVQLPEPNSVAAVTLEARRDAAAVWQPVGRFTLYRLSRGAEELQSPPLPVQRVAASQWRLSLEPAGPRLSAASLAVTVRWPQAWLVFAGRAPQPWRLTVGRAGSRPTALPLASLVPGYQPGDEARLPEATLQPLRQVAVDEPGWWEKLRAAGPQEHRRWLLWAVLAFAIAALAWLARGLARELKAAEPPG